ncbi:MAG: hypothetical protein GSR86_07785 [Desulfurococcales archaeon]|nr:hypothetical protein [Desulfurococcales archaeon]
MGMGTVASSTIIFYVLLLLLGFMITVATYSLSSMAKAILIFSSLKTERIEYRSIYHDNTTNTITMRIANTGETLVYDYNDTDVIVTYTSGNTTRIFYAEFRGEYTGTSSQEGWYITGIYDASGVFHRYTNTAPVYWKPNTILEIVIILPSLPDNSTTVTITIATPGGGREYVEFTW